MKNHKNHIDQKIQEALEAHNSLPENTEFLKMHEDAALYKNLFEELQKEPAIELGDDFNTTIIQAAYKKKKVRNVLSKILLYTTVSISLTMMCIVVVLAMDPAVFWEMVDSLEHNSSYLLFGVILFAIIQILDTTLVKSKIPETGI